MTPDDNENVRVNEDHEEKRYEKETGVLSAEAQFPYEIRPAFVRLSCPKE